MAPGAGRAGGEGRVDGAPRVSAMDLRNLRVRAHARVGVFENEEGRGEGEEGGTERGTEGRKGGEGQRKGERET